MSVVKKWVRAAIDFTVLALVCLFVLLLLLVNLVNDDTVSRNFRSPSGAVQVRIEESCFGFGCSQSAYLVRPLRDKRLGNLNVGDPEAIVFDGATVSWNSDETQLSWSVPTRHGTRSGVLNLK